MFLLICNITWCLNIWLMQIFQNIFIALDICWKGTNNETFCYKLKSSFTPTFSIILNWIIKMKALILHIVILNIELCCSFEISVMSNWPNIEIQANVSFVIQKEPPEVFYKENVLKIFAKVTEKLMLQSFFFDRKDKLIKNEALVQVFSCEFCEIFISTFLAEHLWTTVSVIATSI